MKTLPLPLLLVALAVTPCMAEGLASFRFEGTQIGDSLEAFRQRHPDAQQKPSDRAPPLVAKEVTTYVTTNTIADAAQYSFFRNRLYELVVLYRRATIESMGGEEVLRGRLVAKLGPAKTAGEVAGGKVQVWAATNRIGVLISKDNDLGICITDTEIGNKLKKINDQRAAQIDTGF